MTRLKHRSEHDGCSASVLIPNKSPLLSARVARSTLNYLWIDCVDNYFTVHNVVGFPINETIVYRNLAHQVNYTDLNCLSVLQYAIQIVGIKHVIVCGHTDCAMLRLSIQHTPADLVENWLAPVQVVYQKYEHRLGLYQTESLRMEKLCELNVIEQVLKLCQTTVVQNAWKQGQELTIHGWAYSSDSRLLNDLAIDIVGKQDIFPVYRAAVWRCIEKP